MVVNCDRQRLFGDVLADHILIERTPDFDGFRNADGRRLTARILVELFVENALADINATVADVDARTGYELAHLGVALADINATVADVDARTGYELAHLGVALATKRAHCEVGSPRHIIPFLSSFYSPALRGETASAPVPGRSPKVGVAVAPSTIFNSLRDLITSSTKPYSFASAADI